jgi:hypothetical protein
MLGEDGHLSFCIFGEEGSLSFVFCLFEEDGHPNFVFVCHVDHLILVCMFGKDDYLGFGMFGEDGHPSFYRYHRE